MPDLYSEELSAYLDGELPAERRRRLEAHLAECADCAAILADLRAIVTAAPHYPGRQPAQDLWPAIRAGVGDAVPMAPPAAPVRVRPGERRFSWPQLVAASLLMAALGGGAVWLAIRGGTAPAPELAVQPTDPDPSNPGDPSSSGSFNSAKTVAYAEQQYDAAVRDLELVLEAGRNRLDSVTVRTIEQSLLKIDAAIAEARAAVQRDPSNAYLSRQIAANMRRKLNLLRVATNAIAARTS